MSLFEYDLAHPLYFFGMIVFMFITIVLRYTIIASLFFLVFHSKKFERWKHKKINLKDYPPKQFRTEIKWSILSALIFAITGALTLLAWQKGYTAFYKDVNEYGIVYLVVSLPIYMIVHETYYYWTHRLMHHPKLFHIVHKVHHKSYIPSPWTAFSFHPYESLLAALILPLMMLTIPIHYIALLVYMLLMTLYSVVNHLNIEFFPQGTEKHWLGKWFIGATYHGLHHDQMRHNFGLYFTFWDKWLKTESPDFISLFRAKSISKRNSLE